MSVNGTEKSATQRIRALDSEARAAADAIIARIRSGTMSTEQKQRLVVRIMSVLSALSSSGSIGGVQEEVSPS